MARVSKTRLSETSSVAVLLFKTGSCRRADWYLYGIQVKRPVLVIITHRF